VSDNHKPIATAEAADDGIRLKVGGTWRLIEELPSPLQVVPPSAAGRKIQVLPDDLTDWDSSLPLFVLQLRRWCQDHDAELDIDALPATLRRLCNLIRESEETAPKPKPAESQTHPVVEVTRRATAELEGVVRFIGECAIGTAEVPTDIRQVRWKDLFVEMVEAGPKALPIVGLLSFLIGVVFAFETATQLRQFGAQIYVIDGVALSVVRQIGPLIAAVVLAGRTGAAFAAHIGNMKLGGEIDALEMIAVSPINFLVLPRLAALLLMMPLIALYSDLLGILGGLVVSVSMLQIPATEFWVRVEGAVALTDVNVGLVKSLVFGILIGMAGTLRGLQCERSSAGVGRATTSAVVTGITAIIVADAVFAFVLNNLGY